MLVFSYLLIAVAALLTAGLTFFSGFGLGTLFLPVFALFFALEVAVALTAIVHLANNLFKLFLVGRHAHRRVVLSFGLPAILGAYAGALVLHRLKEASPLFTYQLLGRTLAVTPQKLVIAVLIIVFALVELSPITFPLAATPRLLPLGGLLSGFFGGLSGHQGALRSAFLLKCGLSKEAFLGTGVTIACLVDLSRLSGYCHHFLLTDLREHAGILGTAVAAAFLGTLLGNRLLPKVPWRNLKRLITVMLVLLALGLAGGLI
jgi:hypothetical protein